MSRFCALSISLSLLLGCAPWAQPHLPELRPSQHAAVGCYRFTFGPWSFGSEKFTFDPPSEIELSAEVEPAYVGVAKPNYRLLPSPDPLRGPSKHALWLPTRGDSIRLYWTDHGWSGYELPMEQRGDTLRGTLSFFSDVILEWPTRTATGVRIPCRGAPSAQQSDER